jgi:hypothetical protein
MWIASWQKAYDFFWYVVSPLTQYLSADYFGKQAIHNGQKRDGSSTGWMIGVWFFPHRQGDILHEEGRKAIFFYFVVENVG